MASLRSYANEEKCWQWGQQRFAYNLETMLTNVHLANRSWLGDFPHLVKLTLLLLENTMGKKSTNSFMRDLPQPHSQCMVLGFLIREWKVWHHNAAAGMSTQHAIAYVLHLVLRALDSGSCSARLFFADFRKGFDLIDHTILLSKLHSCNPHPCLARWIAAFLQGCMNLHRDA